MFSSDPARALARWERERKTHDRWLLDASVGYVWSDAALDAIATLPNCRLILCLRDQFDRTASAYRLYRALYGLPPAEAIQHPAYEPKFANASRRALLRDDALAPSMFHRSLDCRRGYTLLRWTEAEADFATREQVDACDAEFDRFERQSLSVRIVFEWARWTKTSVFPQMSILINSYFTATLRRLCSRFDPGRISLATLSAPMARVRMAPHLGSLFGAKVSERELVQLHPSAKWGFDVPQRDLGRARELVATEFDKDTRELLALIDRIPGLDLSLFSPEALFRAPA
jgi:hypothetical protein